MCKRLAGMLLAAVMLISFKTAYGEEYPVDVSGMKAAMLCSLDGQGIIEYNSAERLEVGGLGRLPLLLAVCDKIDGGGLALTDKVAVSREAARAPGSTAFLEAYENAEVSMLLKAAVVICAGDAIYALSEAAYGSMEACAMAAAEKLNGMGIQAESGEIASGSVRLSADDLVRIGGKLSESECFSLYSGIFYDAIQHEDGRTTELASSNRLIKSCVGTNGVATGSSAGAGYCGVFSAKRGGGVFICAVIGAENSSERAAKAKAMLEYAFAAYDIRTLAKQGERIAAVEVKNGTASVAELTAREGAVCLLPKNAELQSDKDIPDMLEAPVSKDDVLGSVTYSLDGAQIARVELVSPVDIPRAGIVNYAGRILCEWLHA